MTAAAPPLDRSVWSDLHRRPWTISGRQYAALVRFAWAGDWVRVTQRELAASEGYSLKGAHTFVRSMRAGGLLAVRTRIGCRGGTWLSPVRGLLAALQRRPPNVSSVDREKRRTTAETFELGLERPPEPPRDDPGAPPGEDAPSGYAAWLELGKRLGSRRAR